MTTFIAPSDALAFPGDSVKPGFLAAHLRGAAVESNTTALPFPLPLSTALKTAGMTAEDGEIGAFEIRENFAFEGF